MKPEKEIIHAAHLYMVEAINNRGEGLLWADIDFANGATWAFDLMKAENERLRAESQRFLAGWERLQAENERLRAAIADALAIAEPDDRDALFLVREILEKA